MEEEIRSLLAEEIKGEIADLSHLEPGSREQQMAIDNLATLYRLKIEETKNDLEYDEKYNRRVLEADTAEREELLKREQLSEQKKDRYFRIGMSAAELILPLIFYGTWMKRGFKFEETGAFTSTTFRGLFNRFKPTKK